MAVVLDVLASYIQNMLTEMAMEEVNMMLGVSTEIDKMGLKLAYLKNFLADADRRNITDKNVQAWVRELRDAMYDATDILDLCQLKIMEQGPSRDAGCLNPLLFCMRDPLYAHNIGKRLKNLNKRLEGIRERSAAFSFINLEPYKFNVTSSHPISRETSGELDESSVVGEKIKDDTRDLIEQLTNKECKNNEVMVFAIVGVGGIGKTTLAQKIFNDDVIQQEFTKKIWLSVNQEFNETDLLKRVITEAGGDYQTVGVPKTSLERILKEVVKGHKTLIVMDDVWDHYAWEGVLKTLLVNVIAQGSRVLVTTRKDMVARGMFAKVPYHRVEKLELQDAWSLLKKQVFGNENDRPDPMINMLEDIGLRIVEKCDCLPLAIKVMGGLLRQKTKRTGDWEKVLNDSMWSVFKMPDQLNNAIYLSYQDLCPPLKQCFLHYSLIPKGVVMRVDGLVGMWISEGIVHSDSHELEELGREYYNELISRNLIEPERRAVDESYCKMHDVIRSFAQYVAREEALVAHMGDPNITSKLNSQKFLRLFLYTEGSAEELQWSFLQPQKSLRTLLLMGHMKVNPGDSLVNFSSLRTLHLYSTNCDPLVESLHQLKHLRYLGMERCGISILPENIGKMKLLQHITICTNESLLKLPDSIVELRQLRTLYLNGTRIKNIPKGFHTLNNLRNLEGFPAHIDGGGWCSLQELGPLSQLSFLGITGLENVSAPSFATKARLGEKAHLRYLRIVCTSRLGDDGCMVKGVSEEEQQRIEVVLDELCPPPCLEKLSIEGYFGRRLPAWVMSTAGLPLKCLRFLMMEDMACCTELPDGLCQLPCLELLQIFRAPAIKRVGPEFLQHYHYCSNRSDTVAGFPKLRQLIFIGMVDWEEWLWDEQVKAMPVLEELILERCKLRCVPLGLATQARALRELCLYNVDHLRSLENFCSVVKLQVFQNPDLVKISNFPKLQKLDIVSCPKLNVLEGVPALSILQMEDYSMHTLPGYLQDVNPKHVLLYCTLYLLASIADGESNTEWNKFNHIQQVKAYARVGDISRRCYVLYTRDPLSLETNISLSALDSGDEVE